MKTINQARKKDRRTVPKPQAQIRRPRRAEPDSACLIIKERESGRELYRILLPLKVWDSLARRAAKGSLSLSMYLEKTIRASVMDRMCLASGRERMAI